MRVLVLTDKFAPHPGGTAVLWSQWCSHWPPDQVTVIAPRTPGWREYDARQAYKIIRIPYPDLPKVRMPILWLLMLLRACWELLVRRVSLVHVAQIVPFGPAGPLFRKLFRVPYMLHIYGEEMNSLLKSAPKRALIRRVLQGSAGVTAISRFTAGLVAQAGYRERVLLAPPAPAVLACADSPGQNPLPVLLTVARLTQRKGQDRVLALLPALRRRYPGLTYLIAGIGPYESHLRQLATSLNLDDCVRFLGKVPSDALAQLYGQADIFVHPNRELADGDVEGFGIVLLEASLCGLPVIAGRSGGGLRGR